jgi:hypothetical protein
VGRVARRPPIAVGLVGFLGFAVFFEVVVGLGGHRGGATSGYVLAALLILAGLILLGRRLLVFPLTFVSSAYVPVETMPSWMQGFAEHQPITVMVVDAVRVLTAGGGRSAWRPRRAGGPRPATPRRPRPGPPWRARLPSRP